MEQCASAGSGSVPVSSGNPVKTKKENHFLRLLCGVILLFITYTHYYVPYDYNDIIFGLGRFAIPIFFLISGYFAFSKDEHAEKSLGRKTLHILYLLIFLKLLYLALDVVYYSFGVIDMDYLIHSFVLWTGTTSHAWFLYSLVLVYIFWWLLYRYKVKFEKTIPLIFIVLAVDLLFTEFLPMFGVDYIGDYTTVFIGESLYMFIAIPFFIAGYFLHKHKERFDAMFSTKLLLAILVIGLVLSYFETVAVPTANLYFGSILVAITLFFVSFRIPEDRLRSRPLEYMGKYLTPWLYVFYPGVVFFCQNILLKSFSSTEWIYYGLGPFIAVAMNIALAYLFNMMIRKMKKRAKNKKAAQAATIF